MYSLPGDVTAMDGAAVDKFRRPQAMVSTGRLSHSWMEVMNPERFSYGSQI